MITNFKIFETKDATFKNFKEILEWEKFVGNIQKELIPVFENDDAKLLDNIIKKYKFNINEYLFYNFNPGMYKNNILQERLEKLANYSRTGNNKQPELNVIKYLIENGADINMYNNWSETPLLLYLRYSGQQRYGEKTNNEYNVKIVKYLLDNNANPNIPEKGTNFQTCLTYCSSHEGLDLVKLLIKYNADPYFGKLYNHSQGSYLYTPYRAYFNSNDNLDKLIYLITNYNINPFETQKNLIFDAGNLTYNNGNFFDYFLSRLPKDEEKRYKYIKECYPQLLNYKFQKHIIERYNNKGIQKIIEIGANPKIANEYDDIGMIINAKNFNL